MLFSLKNAIAWSFQPAFVHQMQQLRRDEGFLWSDDTVCKTVPKRISHSVWGPALKHVMLMVAWLYILIIVHEKTEWKRYFRPWYVPTIGLTLLKKQNKCMCFPDSASITDTKQRLQLRNREEAWLWGREKTEYSENPQQLKSSLYCTRRSSFTALELILSTSRRNALVSWAVSLILADATKG